MTGSVHIQSLDLHRREQYNLGFQTISKVKIEIESYVKNGLGPNMGCAFFPTALRLKMTEG